MGTRQIENQRDQENRLKRRSSEIIDHNNAKKTSYGNTSIHKLPNELLLEIFTKMDQHSLKSCALVNKTWSRIITQSPVTMKKLPLKVSDGNLKNNQSFPELFKLTRRYDCVTMDDVFVLKSIHLKQLMKIGKNVTNLNIKDCSFSQSDFIKLCRCFPNLETLEVRWCSGSHRKRRGRPTKPTILSKLKYLVIYGDGWMIKNINCPQLIDLVLCRFYMDDQQDLVKFLNAQTSLKFLRLNNIFELFNNRSGREVLMDLRFQLQGITLSNLDLPDERQLKSLLHCAKYCESAILGPNIPANIFQEAVKSFRNLNFLFVDAGQLTSEVSYRYIRPNTNLKCVKIGGVFSSTNEVFLDFISVFPKIENLDLISLKGLSTTNDILWRSMSGILKNVNSLKIQRLNDLNMVNLKFPFMITFTVDMVGFTSKESWEVFSKNNPIVSKLIFESTPIQIFYGADVIKIVRSLKYISYLRNSQIGPYQLFAL